jgi:dihydropteroate synthase
MGKNPNRKNEPIKQFNLAWGAHRLMLGRQTRIMGVLNVTPDSFSDGGRFDTVEKAVTQAGNLVAEGADILDIGGESTRPFSDSVSTNEEIDRVVPVIEKIAGQVDVPISIDTPKAEVARQALAAGAGIINDVSALKADDEMAQVAGRSDVPLILMHMRGQPKTMQKAPVYDDLIGDVMDYFNKAVKRALAGGVAQERIILDPGIGFGKTAAHHLTLIKRLSAFSAIDFPLLIGPSRKAFIRATVKRAGQPDLDPGHPDVALGTQAVIAAGILNGAHIVRVHDVAQTRVVIKMVDAIRHADR